MIFIHIDIFFRKYQWGKLFDFGDLRLRIAGASRKGQGEKRQGVRRLA
jgi:hypothetical protein